MKNYIIKITSLIAAMAIAISFGTFAPSAKSAKIAAPTSISKTVSKKALKIDWSALFKKSSSKSTAKTTKTASTAKKEPAQKTKNISKGETINNAEFLKEAAAKLNRERKAAGLSELKADNGMSKVAATRAKEISKSFSHTRPDGRKSYTAYADCGVKKPTAVAENISMAKGFIDAKDIINVWMNSSGHRANILNGKYTRFGLAWYKANDGKEYCVLLLGNG